MSDLPWCSCYYIKLLSLKALLLYCSPHSDHEHGDHVEYHVVSPLALITATSRQWPNKKLVIENIISLLLWAILHGHKIVCRNYKRLLITVFCQLFVFSYWFEEVWPKLSRISEQQSAIFESESDDSILLGHYQLNTLSKQIIHKDIYI